jgi:predicted HicB family RNase H-like nuclease
MGARTREAFHACEPIAVQESFEMKQETVAFTVRISAESAKKLKAYADKTDRSLNYLVREILEAGLRQLPDRRNLPCSPSPK